MVTRRKDAGSEDSSGCGREAEEVLSGPLQKQPATNPREGRLRRWKHRKGEGSQRAKTTEWRRWRGGHCRLLPKPCQGLNKGRGFWHPELRSCNASWHRKLLTAAEDGCYLEPSAETLALRNQNHKL